MKETIARINKSKSWFSEKVNNIDIPLARLTEKKRERTAVNKIRNVSSEGPEQGKGWSNGVEADSVVRTKSWRCEDT